MQMEKIHITKELEGTYLATFYGKVLDSRAKEPILGDPYADEVARRIDYNFEKIFTRGSEISVPIRSKHFDQWTREFLAAHPAATVLHLGPGLDARVFRIDPPADVRWYDIDLPHIIELRKRLYPERHDYKMIGSSVTDLKWLDEIPADKPVLVVAEGLVMYLPEKDGIALFNKITEKFPGGEFIFDAYSGLMCRLITMSPPAKKAGIKLPWGFSDPRKLEKQVPRLKLIDAIPFFTLPELIERMKVSGVQALIGSILIHIGPYRNMIRHLRYRF